MSNATTQPAPFDNSLKADPGSHRRQAFWPLRWLRTRLFHLTAPELSGRPGPGASTQTTLAGFPPQVGRGQSLRRAHLALQRLMASHEGLRQVLPHLSLLEQTLARKGSKALQRLPASVLQHALEQLEDLQSTENNADMAVLRTRLVESLALRSVSWPSDSVPGSSQSTFEGVVQGSLHSGLDEASRRLTSAIPMHSRH